jgi:hypothetical protein
VRKERYAGISGSTHGETNETTPARKAVRMLTLLVTVLRRADTGGTRGRRTGWRTDVGAGAGPS